MEIVQVVVIESVSRPEKPEDVIKSNLNLI
jgi:hypothetical protein